MGARKAEIVSGTDLTSPWRFARLTHCRGLIMLVGRWFGAVIKVSIALALLAAADTFVTTTAYAQNPVQGRRDFARMNALNTDQQTSLKNRAQQAARDARSVVDGARIDCDVTIARLIGYTRRDKPLFEIACKQSTGFIVDTSTMSPRAFDCRILAAGAAEARAAGRKVSRDAVCTLFENTGR